MIYLSFDQDWAPDWATLAIHDRLHSAGLQGTLFVTQDGPVLTRARETGTLELGWHPNFLPGSSHGESTEAVLDTMASVVPEASGARAHCLIRGTPYLQAYAARGLRYDAADLRDGEPNLAPFMSWTGMARIPIWFEDDVHLQRGGRCVLGALDLDAPGLKVFTFHPVLVALNACDLTSYASLKADLARRRVALPDATPDDFGAFHQSALPGIADLLDGVIETLRDGPLMAGGHLASLVTSLSPPGP